MRADNDVIELQQRMILRRRLLLPHIQPGTGQLAGAQRVRQRHFIMDEAACGGDEIGGRFHQRIFPRADHLAGGSDQRAVDRYIVRLLQQLIQLHLLRPLGADLLGAQQRVEGQHPHPEQAAAQLGHPAADMTKANDADGAPDQIMTLVVIARNVGLAAHEMVGLNDALGQRQHHRHHMLGHRFLVATGLVHGQHAGRGTVRQIERVVAGPVGGHHHQIRGALQQLGGAKIFRDDLIARSADLVAMRLRQYRLGFRIRRLVLQPGQLHVRPTAEDLREHGGCQVLDVENAFIVGGHLGLSP